MIIPLIALLSVVAQPDETTISASIEIRPSIINPIGRYAGCLGENLARLSQTAGPLRAARMRRVVEQARRACRRVRVEARVEATRLIELDTEVPVAARGAIIEAALADVDASDELFLRELERREQAQRRSKN